MSSPYKHSIWFLLRFFCKLKFVHLVWKWSPFGNCSNCVSYCIKIIRKVMLLRSKVPRVDRKMVGKYLFSLWLLTYDLTYQIHFGCNDSSAFIISSAKEEYVVFLWSWHWLTTPAIPYEKSRYLFLESNWIHWVLLVWERVCILPLSESISFLEQI